MPVAAPKPCSHPGCGVIVKGGGGRCSLHLKKSNFSKKLSRQERGYGSAWEKLRKVVLSRDAGLCVQCRNKGILTIGNIVDHIIPKIQGGDDDLENLQTICKPCHTLKTAYESVDGRAASLPSWLPVPTIEVRVVCGPPGSGKSTYVAELAAAADLVIDIDVIAAKISGAALYHASYPDRMAAIRVRNKLLASLADRECAYPRAWLIVAAGTPDKREFWQKKYGNVIIMPTDKSECIKRIRNDIRRPESSKQGHIDAVYQWY